MEFNIDQYKAFFFDFDGVIADSVGIKTAAFAELYKPYGEEIVEYVVRHHEAHGGMSRFLKISHYHKELLYRDLSDDELKLMTDKFSDLVLEKVVQASFIKGAQEFIHMLRKQNKRMFIVSGTPEDEIRRIVREKGLDDYFLEVKGAPAGKEKNLWYLLEKYSIEARESVFFGDSPEDLKAASAVGMKFAPINYCGEDVKGYKDFVDFTSNSVLEVK